MIYMTNEEWLSGDHRDLEGIKDITIAATVTRDKDGIHVDAFAVDSNVDRPHLAGWLLGSKNGRLASRLAIACEAGAAVEILAVTSDRYGNTLHVKRNHVIGRRMNADLTRLGY